MNVYQMMSTSIFQTIVTMGCYDKGMKTILLNLYVLAMVAAIFGVDFAFFRNQFWERLAANIGIVLVFAAFYLIFLKRP